MDFNVVTLEIADLIVHFDYFDKLVTEAVTNTTTTFAEDQEKIRKKSKEHQALFFPGINFYDAKKQLHPLPKMKVLIVAKLQGIKAKEIHELVEKLTKDAKKIKKLYLAITKSNKAIGVG